MLLRCDSYIKFFKSQQEILRVLFFIEVIPAFEQGSANFEEPVFAEQ